MSANLYRHFPKEIVVEYIKLYYATDDYTNFVDATDKSELLSSTFLVDASFRLYDEIVRNIYWAVRILAHPERDNSEVREYIRTFNPIFQTIGDINDTGETISPTEVLFAKLIQEYKLEA
jgi:hypothetical protein